MALTTALAISIEISFILLVILMVLILRIRKLKRLLSGYENKNPEEVLARYFKYEKENEEKEVATDESTVNESLGRNKEKFYVARIKNLEKFREMYINSHKEIQILFSSIEKLKNSANSKPAPDTLVLQNNINKLEAEKQELKKSLNSLFKALDKNTKDAIAFEHKYKQKLEHLTEENEFLVVQIQYLLKQEVDATNDMLSKIKQLENDLASKESELQRIQA